MRISQRDWLKNVRLWSLGLAVAGMQQFGLSAGWAQEAVKPAVSRPVESAENSEPRPIPSALNERPIIVQVQAEGDEIPPAPGEEPPEFDPNNVPTLPPTVVEGSLPPIAEAPAPAFNPSTGSASIIGGFGSAFNTPGASTYLDTERIRMQNYANPNQVFRQAPGVYMRDEDGYGNFPNISLRGVDTTRTAKISIMEDGVLIAPAPYAAPSAYFFPNVGRMNAVEILKGHSQIVTGPHTTGGAINFLSTPIPEDAAYLKATYGSFGDARIHAYAGETVDIDSGRLGYLVEGWFQETDGFRAIDATPDFVGADRFDTGFTRTEPMLKLFYEPDGCTYQRWEAKLGYTEFRANETYLGLSTGDLAADPYRRYQASRFDNMNTNQSRTYVRYVVGDPEEDVLSISNTIYYNRFHRDWFKLHRLDDIDINGNGVLEGEVGGDDRSLSRAIGGHLGNAGLEVLRGQRAGRLNVRHNNREYYAYGYETVATFWMESGDFEHEIQAGLRLHADRVRRFQSTDTFDQDASGTIVAGSIGALGGAGDRRQETQAVAFFLQDNVSYGDLTITPGVRFEHLKLIHDDFDVPARTGSDSLSITGGGVGANYKVDDYWQAIGGFHRGFSPPSPRARVRNDFEEEEVLASEGGVRYFDQEQAFGFQAIGFYSHFNNLLVIDNTASGAAVVTEQVGQVYTGGLEFTLEWDPGLANNWDVRNPYYLTTTYTRARQLSASRSGDAESIFAGGFAGAHVPYVPDWAINIGTGIHADRVGMSVNGTYVSETFTTASNRRDEFNPVAGVADARFGTTDSFWIWDVSGYVKVSNNWKLIGGVQNVFNESYIASRHPHGPRSGAPLMGYVSMEATY